MIALFAASDEAVSSSVVPVFYPDLGEVARWLHLLVEPSQVAELRAIPARGAVEAGYFEYGSLASMACQGVELSSSGLFKGVYFTFNPLNPDLLARSPNLLKRSIRNATDKDVLRRRWILIDVDPRREGTCSSTDAEKARAESTILAIRKYLNQLGWPEPVLADSGNGYHLLYRVDLPADDGDLVQRVLHALAKEFDDEHVEVDRKVFNPARITKLYGSKACKGPDTPERPHRWTRIIDPPVRPEPVPLEMLEALAAPVRLGPSCDGRHYKEFKTEVATPVPTMHLAEKLKRARRYVARMPPAVEGKGGDKQTYSVACRLVIDFDLSPEAALPLMLEYNQRCRPPWDESELIRKLEYAAQEPGERGRLLQRSRRSLVAPLQSRDGTSQQAISPGMPFPAVIPDFIMWDSMLIRPSPPTPKLDKRERRKRPRVMTREWIRDIVRYLFISQKCNRTILPPFLLGQLIWGARTQDNRWPDNWVRTAMGGFTFDSPPEPLCCNRDCPLFGGTDKPHEHLIITATDRFLGVMKQFAVDAAEEGRATFDLHNRLTKEEAEARKAELQEAIEELEQFVRIVSPVGHPNLPLAEASLEEKKSELKRLRPGLRKVEGVRPVYLPVRLFGPSPRSGLTLQQCNLLSALTAELTRTNVDNGRPDEAQVVRGGIGQQHRRERAVPRCPYLEAGQEYVCFNGNGSRKKSRLHGYGFKLTTWMVKAAYPAGDEYPLILGDFRDLAAPFGLVVAGWHSSTRKWIPFEEVLAMCHAEADKARLKECVLRVYTGADFLSRWRRYFAEKLGFSKIPGGEEEKARPLGSASCTVIRSGPELRAWMERQVLTDQELAARLGVDRSAVNRFKTGARRWSKRFQARLDAYLGSVGV